MPANTQKATRTIPAAPRRVSRRPPRFTRERPYAVEPFGASEAIGPVTMQEISPRGDQRLRHFVCGWPEQEAVAEVNGSARALSRGLAPGGLATTVLALSTSAGDLVGWAGVQRRHLCEEPAPIPPGAYIVAIGTAWRYQGRRLDDGRRPGDALMSGVLQRIAVMFEDYPAPYTWARVLPGNGRSLRLFTEHGFIHFSRPGAPAGDICARPAGLGSF